MTSGKSPSSRPSITIKHGEQTYIGSYTADSETITVRYGTRQTTTHLGGAPGERGSTARMILRELVEAAHGTA